MHTRLLALGFVILAFYSVHLDGGTARSAHKHPYHLVSSHFDAPGWDEVICVEMNSWIWGSELEYQYTSTYTQLIFDVIARPGEGWNYRPDSRIKLLGIWD
jgi:hypothetical protein